MAQVLVGEAKIILTAVIQITTAKITMLGTENWHLTMRRSQRRQAS